MFFIFSLLICPNVCCIVKLSSNAHSSQHTTVWHCSWFCLNVDNLGFRLTHNVVHFDVVFLLKLKI